ncbi:hypothetical protein QTP88_026273 [Uroleucon formosanum]
MCEKRIRCFITRGCTVITSEIDSTAASGGGVGGSGKLVTPVCLCVYDCVSVRVRARLHGGDGALTTKQAKVRGRKSCSAAALWRNRRRRQRVHAKRLHYTSVSVDFASLTVVGRADFGPERRSSRVVRNGTYYRCTRDKHARTPSFATVGTDVNQTGVIPRTGNSINPNDSYMTLLPHTWSPSLCQYKSLDV